MNDLTHYGVLGMKWGVRKEYAPHPRKKKIKITKKELRATRYSEVDEDDYGSYGRNRMTKEEREQLKKVAIAATAVLGVSAGVYFLYRYGAIKKISAALDDLDGIPLDSPEALDAAKKAAYDSLHESDLIFSKDFEFHRIERVKDKDFSTIKDLIYVSHRPDDRWAYMTLLKDWEGTGEKYEVVLKAMDEIIAPSKDVARAVFDKLYKSDSQYKNDLVESVAKGLAYAHSHDIPSIATREGIKIDTSMFMPAAKKMVRSDPFGSAMYALVKKGADSEKYLGELKKLGYSAIEDYFDKGTFTKSPVILFNPSSSVNMESYEEVTKEIIDKVTKEALEYRLPFLKGKL